MGRVYCDLVFTDLPRLPTLGTETFAGGLSLHPGGGAAITAAYLAALGRPAFLGATLPVAPFAELVSGALSDCGVDCALSQAAEAGADPQVTVAMAHGGDRAFVTRDAGEPAPVLTVGEITAQGIGHLHVGELKTLTERPDLLDLARAADLTVSLDCGWDDGLTAGAAALIAQVDVFLPNREEMGRLTALGVQPPQSVLTVIKDGAQGARALTPDGVVTQAAAPAQVVDTTGAGDAFNGGFLDRWLDARPLADCLEQGVTCGAQAVAAAGGTAGAARLRQMRRGLEAAQ